MQTESLTSLDADESAGHELAPRTRTILIFFVGTVIALALQFVFALQNGGPSALLHVGAESDLRHQISSELGDVRLWPQQGHDGKFSYAIAREPFGFEASGVDHPAYRYRRYLYSLVAGGFGTLPPQGTLYGLMLIAAIGFGLGAAASADLARSLGAGRWSAIVGLVNLGVLAGVLQLSSDSLAFGLSMAGAATWMRGRTSSALILFVLAAWSKEVYLLIPLGLALWEIWARRIRQAALVLLVPSAIGVVWWTFLAFSFPGTSVTNSAFALPLEGIFEALRLSEPGFSLGSQLVSIALIVTASVLSLLSRNRVLISLSSVWVGVALVSHQQIWHQDSMRAFAPLFTFVAIGVILVTRRSSSARSLSPA